MSELPEEWTEAQMSDVCVINPKFDAQTDKDVQVSFVPMASVSETLGVILDPEVKRLRDVWKGYTHFEGGDVIFAKITPCMENGKCAVADRLTNNKACGSTEFFVLRPHASVSPLYIWYFLRQKAFRQEAALHMTGAVGQRRVPKTYLQNTILPMAPSKEQQRIVETLNTLFERTRRAREELSRIPLLIEHYKQAILSAAFRGELTAEWRSNEKVPDEWPMSNVAAAINDIRYGTSKKCFPEPVGTPVLRIPNVTQNGIDLADMKYGNLDDKEIDKLSLEPGDLLVIRSNGSADLVGRAVLADERVVGFCYAGYLIRLRPDPKACNPKFLLYMLSSPDVRQRIEVNARSTSGVHNINSQELQNLPLPLPSVPEQDEAVRLIEQAMSWLDVVQSDTGQATHLIDHLDQAQLAKAFRGELVPQDPNDEPASVLLERIRQERQAQAPKRRAPRKRAAGRA